MKLKLDMELFKYCRKVWAYLNNTEKDFDYILPRWLLLLAPQPLVRWFQQFDDQTRLQKMAGILFVSVVSIGVSLGITALVLLGMGWPAFALATLYQIALCACLTDIFGLLLLGEGDNLAMIPISIVAGAGAFALDLVRLPFQGAILLVDKFKVWTGSASSAFPAEESLCAVDSDRLAEAAAVVVLAPLVTRAAAPAFEAAAVALGATVVTGTAAFLSTMLPKGSGFD